MKRTHWLVNSAVLAVAFLSAMPLSAGDAGKIPQRSDIEARYKWRLEDLYPSQAAWDKDFEVLKGSLDRFQPYKGRLGDSPATLHSCLALTDSLALLSSKLYIYAHLKLDEDTRINPNQEMGDRIANLSTRLWQAMAYIEPEILSLTIDGASFGEADKTVTFRHTKITGSVAEGDPDTISVSGTSYAVRPVLS